MFQFTLTRWRAARHRLDCALFVSGTLLKARLAALAAFNLWTMAVLIGEPTATLRRPDRRFTSIPLLTWMVLEGVGL